MSARCYSSITPNNHPQTFTLDSQLLFTDAHLPPTNVEHTGVQKQLFVSLWNCTNDVNVNLVAQITPALPVQYVLLQRVRYGVTGCWSQNRATPLFLFRCESRRQSLEQLGIGVALHVFPEDVVRQGIVLKWERAARRAVRLVQTNVAVVEQEALVRLPLVMEGDVSLCRLGWEIAQQ